MKYALFVFLMLPLGAAQASSVVYDFEEFTDSQSLGGQLSGLSFANSTVITEGVSLNEIEFPPASGTNVIFDDGGAISISFDSVVTEVSAYFTYLEAVTFTAFDINNQIVGSAVSQFSTNLAVSGVAGSVPNELMGVSFAGGISSISIVGDISGTSFVMDDLTVTAVPIPAALPLLLSGLLSLAALRRKKLATR